MKEMNKVEFDLMPYCEGCPFFEPKKEGGDVCYISGRNYIAENITVYCENRDICKRVELNIKGE